MDHGRSSRFSKEATLPPTRWKSAFGLALALGGSGCVHVYEPLSGLHRPVVIDTDAANFEDLHLDIHCPPGDFLTMDEAADLCRKVGILFENQGAEVRTSTRNQRLQDQETDRNDTEGAPRAIHLAMELRARDLQERNPPLSWVLCLYTFTLVPAVTESIFAQDVIIRDESGFLLHSDTLRGRLVRRFGLGVRTGNWILDLVWRDDEEDLLGDAAERDLSADLYGQLSQLVFNAAMRASVLSEVPGIPGATP